MGYEYVLAGVRGRIIGDVIEPSWEDYIEPVKKEGNLWVYALDDYISNVHRKVDDIVTRLENIHPREWFSAIYVSEYGADGYEFTLEDGKVKAYYLQFKPYRAIEKNKYEEVPGWDFI